MDKKYIDIFVDFFVCYCADIWLLWTAAVYDMSSVHISDKINIFI